MKYASNEFRYGGKMVSKVLAAFGGFLHLLMTDSGFLILIPVSG